MKRVNRINPVSLHLSSREDVAARSHCPANQDRLARKLVINWNKRMVRWKRSRGTLLTTNEFNGPFCQAAPNLKRYFAMDEKSFEFAVNHMLLHFGDVVGHVIDQVHVQVVGRRVELLGEGLFA